MLKIDFLEKVLVLIAVTDATEEDFAQEDLWDSIGKLSVLSYVQNEFGPDAVTPEVRSSQTIAELADALAADGHIES